MDVHLLTKTCACVSKTCNNRPSILQWCSNYSCSYNRSLTFGKPEKKARKVREKTLIEEQREAQKLVMEEINKQRAKEKSGIDKGMKFDGMNGCCSQENDSTASPHFELFPCSNSSHRVSSHDTCHQSQCYNRPSDSENAYPECLLPSNISAMSLPYTSNPYEFTGRKRKVRLPRETKEVPEPEGNPCSVMETTSILGYRPMRRHFIEKPTFIWF